MSLLTATQITAVATAVLAAGAIVTAVFAYLAFRKQSQEVRTLDQQARDQTRLLEIQSGQLEAQREQLADQLAERKREANERYRAQAACVFITESKAPGHEAIPDTNFITGYAISPSVTATVHNRSDQPIYNVQLRWHRGYTEYGEPNPELVGVILPGDKAERTREFEDGTDMADAGAMVRFTDADGQLRLREPDGELSEQAIIPRDDDY